MSGRTGVPSAWDDDWTNTASTVPPKAESAAKLSKAERRAQHLEQQKQLWDSADNPGRHLWLEAQGAVVNKQELKPQVTLLSRKPPQIAKKSAAEDDEDSEQEAQRKYASELEERQRKAKLDHEEKQRRYAEARERIMGSSQSSTTANSRESSQARDPRKQKSRVNPARRSQHETPTEQSPARATAPATQLFDPEDMGRRLAPRRENSDVPRGEQPLRQPRGPANSGRGGFGFAPRGGGYVA